MGKTGIIGFVAISVLMLFLVLAGILIFLQQYRRRKLGHEKEKFMLNAKHEQELLTTQLEIQQQTMQHIGREIHDNVGQKLTLASLYSQQLDYEGKYPEIKEKIVSIGSILNESLIELRNLSKSLTSSYIADTPLAGLLQQECNRVNASGQCSVIPVILYQGQLSALVKTIVVRIVQEFLQNSLKHAGCKTIRLSLRNTTEGLLLEMDDDGKGFDTANPARSEGIGLQNMKRRAELVGARIEIKPGSLKGTILKLFIPSNKLNQQA